jgi:hypothetical protein
MTALVIAQRVDVPGELFSCKIDAQLFRGVDAASTTLTAVKSQWGVTYQTMNANIVADTVNGGFKVIVNGQASQTWRWVIRVSSAESIL